MSRVEHLAEGVTLYLGDCREILPTLPKVDAVVTDIPYEASQASNGLRRLDYGEWDCIGNGSEALSVLAKMTAPTVIAWCAWEQLNDIVRLYPERSWRPLAWVKSNPTVLNGEYLFLPFGELAYYGKLAGAWFGGNCVRGVWHGPAPTEREHPTQKPLALMQWCVVNTVAPRTICLDPYMGSGTTGVAAVKLGRGFIGIEKDTRFFSIACRRISEALKQPDLFIEKPKPSVQEALTF